MESFGFENFVSLIYVFVSWILVLFLLTAKSNNKLSNIILAVYILVDAQDSSGLFAHFFLYPKYPDLGMLLNSTVFLKMPLLFLYIQSVVYSDFKLSKRHLWHVAPFIIDFLIFLPNYYFKDVDAQHAFLNREGFDKILEIRLSYIIVHLQILVYAVWLFQIIRKYKKLLLENYSDANLYNYKWLFQLVSIVMLIALIATFKNLFKFTHFDTAYKYTFFVVNLMALSYISWLIIKALHNPELFRGIRSDLQLVKNMVSEKEYDQNIDEEDFKRKDIEKLQTYMTIHEPHLNPSLSIEDLASQINIPSKELSVLINSNLNQHFFDFVNGYRIRKAMEILENPDNSNLTILEILYEVGFNSKSSFNTAFKKYTGKTPTEFRNTRMLSVS